MIDEKIVHNKQKSLLTHSYTQSHIPAKNILPKNWLKVEWHILTGLLT